MTGSRIVLFARSPSFAICFGVVELVVKDMPEEVDDRYIYCVNFCNNVFKKNIETMASRKASPALFAPFLELG